MLRLTVLACVATIITAAPNSGPQRIVGGSITEISEYPQNAAILFSRTLTTYYQTCGGVIINNQAVLTAAHCLSGWPAIAFRVRVGSSFANSGGAVHTTSFIIMHPIYNPFNHDSDIAIIKVMPNIIYANNAVQPAVFATNNYNVADNQAVWAVGWGSTMFGGLQSEQLRHVQLSTVNQATCRTSYLTRNRNITDNMICAGNTAGGGRDQCLGDEGGPLFHNGNVVGIGSWVGDCGEAQFPAVNTRISKFIDWIQSNA